ncbi:hypothetical protein BDP81DRAFT_177742 [Colletotrichum phormii]|uniref:Uncharacterized protein n=1 Tax=Colletotrichum phormii TaxID=359342 RepID=A0AAJ0EHP4_9PEZI|nr:uncharacterized protein BDP81DRAFT_177742 [Colletotrichum phormii]KAK1639473.1 hypothetical protein BDP81DRAFT_177742 [Colletotrichum phormii]
MEMQAEHQWRGLNRTYETLSAPAPLVIQITTPRNASSTEDKPTTPTYTIHSLTSQNQTELNVQYFISRQKKGCIVSISPKPVRFAAETNPPHDQKGIAWSLAPSPPLRLRLLSTHTSPRFSSYQAGRLLLKPRSQNPAFQSYTTQKIKIELHISLIPIPHIDTFARQHNKMTPNKKTP